MASIIEPSRKLMSGKRRAARATKSRSGSPLGALPEWNLADLYLGLDDPQVKQDLDTGHFSCVTLQTTDPDHSNAEQPLISTAAASVFSKASKLFCIFFADFQLRPLSKAGLSGNLR